ncbi:NUDIX domain-containing protein [Actinomadura sp. LD22]|uniref:NUDIX domain-containing protein n=1 Tax=Actinomadura physcomitrii TaxID=2650748 RepID=A0A6I4M5B8_9ACTN|nr:NUDIX domain-containing protein [Actinomadura physcomitrii]
MRPRNGEHGTGEGVLDVIEHPAPEVVSSRAVYENPWISVREDRVIHTSGEPGLIGLVTMTDGVTILPIAADGRVFLVREYKYGLGGPSIELVSGGLDDGEAPVAAARRELAEELGLTAREWIDCGHVDPFTAIVRCRNHLFIARDLTEGEAAPEPTEHIEPLVMRFDEALEMALDGTITHSATCCLLMRARLRSLA